MDNDFATMSTRDIKEALKLGHLNIGSIKPEYQPELKSRIDALEAEYAERKRGKRVVTVKTRFGKTTRIILPPMVADNSEDEGWIGL